MDETKDQNPVLFPGHEKKRHRGKGNTRQFKGFPKVGGNSSKYDRNRIKREYLESPIVDWQAYCESRRYNYQAEGLNWHAWMREKKYRTAWKNVSMEIEDAGSALGPRTLLRALEAVKEVPEALAGMLQVCKYSVQIHLDEVREDMAFVKQGQLTGTPVPRGTKINAGSQDILFLSNALKNTADALYKALGIDMAAGINPERWMQLVEDQLSRIDGSAEAAQEAETMEFEIMGGSKARALMKEAVEKYLDKPQALPVIEVPVQTESDLEPEAEEDE